MSKRSKAADRAARAAALRAEQERQEKRRRILTIVGVTAVLVVIGVIAVWLGVRSTKTDDSAAVPASASGDFGFVVGEKGADHEVVVYEDFLCPACKAFEDAFNQTLEDAVADGKATVEYRPLNFLSRFGDYSERSANAMAVVVDASGVEVAKEFHDLLYEEQPPESGPYPDDDWLVEKAVEAGAKESEVRPGIEDLAFAGWVDNGIKAAQNAGVSGTPTLLVDGEAIDATTLPDALK